MHADGTRPARAWDDIVAPPVPPGSARPAAAPPAAPVRPPRSGNGAGPSTNGGPAPVTAVPPPGHLGATSLAAAPVTAPTPVPPPPMPAPPAPDRTAPERGNGHLRAAPIPLADPDADTTPDFRPQRRRPERERDREQRPGWSTRRRRRKSRARKVRRQIRHVDAWSVLKFSLLFYLVLYMVVLVAAVLLWNAATSTGLVDNVESFVEELFGFETFQFEPNQMLRAAALTGLVLVLAGTTMNVLMAVLFNLISDLIGGIKVTVIEEERRRPLV